MSGPVAAAAALLAVVVAISATIFGLGFAPEAHHEETAGAHARVVEEGGKEAEAEKEEQASHAGEEDAGATAGAIVSSILISLAGIALVPLTFLATRRRPSPVALAEEHLALPPRSVVGTASVVLALLSIGAAVIHFAVIAQHFDAWWLTGMFFVGIALFQLGWGLVVLIGPSSLVYVAGAIVNALIVVTWIVSRTTGVPVGPEAGEAEVVGFPDALATAFEVVLVAVLVALEGEWVARRPVRYIAQPAAGWGSAAVVASLTALALVILA